MQKAILEKDKQSSEKTSAEQKKATATVAVNVKKKVLLRDRTCQYNDPQTGKTCGSRWQLEIDHIQPKWANGNDEAGVTTLPFAASKSH